ncbi:MAG TPA: protein-glutamate O-methyltransferase CheR [Natronincola sp.]|nr:protein-glutamate O-methyltransferase CheR [Natronincola sp.]
MNNYEKLKNDIYKALEIDLNAYKEQQMRRRINQWLDRHRLKSYDELIDMIRKDQTHKENFTKYLTINTSNFFRDVNVFKEIEEKVLPAIGKNNRPRIWSAGASIGAEIYSIAILLAELGIRPSMLLATDIDEIILQKARDGIYLNNQMNGIKDEYKDKYFKQLEDGSWAITPKIKTQVKFEKHNLLKDNFQRSFDLILCRNVFIYFTSATQSELIRKFVLSLKPQGYFIVGSAEQIMDPNAYNLSRVSYCIYQKNL